MPQIKADQHEFRTTQKHGAEDVPQPNGPGWMLVESHANVIRRVRYLGAQVELVVLWSFLWVRKLKDAP